MGLERMGEPPYEKGGGKRRGSLKERRTHDLVYFR